MKVPIKHCAIFGIALVGSTGANAQQGNGWQFEATPYLWMAGMQGDVGIGKITAEGVETSFGDIVKSLRAGFIGAFEARKDRFGVLFDAIYMQLSQSTPAPAPFLGDVQARPTQQGYSLVALWRIDDAHRVDLVGGVRVNDIKLDLDLSASALAPQGRSLSQRAELGRRDRRRARPVSDRAAMDAGRLCRSWRRHPVLKDITSPTRRQIESWLIARHRKWTKGGATR